VTTIPSVDWTEISEIAIKVGRKVASRWPGIDAEDCAQEALKAAIARPALMTDRQEDKGFVFAFMEKVATQYASNERYEYMMRSAQYIYTPKEVRRLLEGFWNEDARSVPDGEDDQINPKTDSATGYLDMDSAMKEMPGDDVWRLQRRYLDGLEYPSPAARKAADRAVDRLTKLMNYRANGAGPERGVSPKEVRQPFSPVVVTTMAPKAPYTGDVSRALWEVRPGERAEFTTARNRDTRSV
jgi:DNA-directed RNA polymerase specialized sigma24 family protein